MRKAKEKYRLRLVTSLLPLMVLVTAACDGSVYRRGRVRGVGDVPVGDATIVLARTGSGRYWVTRSGGDGCFELGGVIAPGRIVYALVATKEGYKPLKVDVPSNSHEDLEITLADNSSDAESVFVVRDRDVIGCDWLSVPRDVEVNAAKVQNPDASAAAPNSALQRSHTRVTSHAGRTHGPRHAARR